MYKLLKKPFLGRFMVKWRNPLTAQQQQEWHPLPVPSKSGATLVGLFAEALTDAPKATIVLGHPMGKEAKGYFLKSGYTDLLRRHGYHVVVFDMNGFGESGHGNFSYAEDIVAIGHAARAQFPALPLGYWGISLGGQYATLAFTDPSHDYQFAIVESAATSLDEFWVHFPAAYRMLRVLSWLLPAYAQSIHMVERIKEARNLHSLLLIYSAADEWVPVEMGRRFQQNSPVPTELWTVPSGAHAQLMKSAHRAEYEAKALAYFDQAVAPLRS